MFSMRNIFYECVFNNVLILQKQNGGLATVEEAEDKKEEEKAQTGGTRMYVSIKRLLF